MLAVMTDTVATSAGLRSVGIGVEARNTARESQSGRAPRRAMPARCSSVMTTGARVSASRNASRAGGRQAEGTYAPSLEDGHEHQQLGRALERDTDEHIGTHPERSESMRELAARAAVRRR
jgi:hypothetical protein